MLQSLGNRWTLLGFLGTALALGALGGATGEEASGQDSQTVTTSDGQKVLRAPNLDGWNGHRTSPRVSYDGSDTFAAAFHYDAFVFEKMANKPQVAGIVRRGTALKLGNKVSGPGCKNGTWYQAVPFGYVCSSLGFHVSDSPTPKTYGVPPAKVTNHLPYQYARVVTKRAPRYYRLPTVEEEKQARLAMQNKGKTPEVVSSLMEGDYFLALADKEKRDEDGAEFYRTVRGRYVRVSDLELRNPDPVRGEELNRNGWRLPIAFVWGEDRQLFDVSGSEPRVIGTAEKHARFRVAEEVRKGGEPFVVGSAGAVRKGEVRVARTTKAPSGIPAGSKWVHVDLPEQTLVAYEGQKPVYATVISSGKEGYEPPTGLFKVQQKYISTTMNATDPIDGFYEVEEVPWTLYYHRGYALHGAYWHTDFGKVRSHGCTNIAPVDARWIYYWSDPEVPPAWHAVRFQPDTTYVYFTN